MDFIKAKKILWKKIKADIIKEIGTEYEISVEGLEREDQYFHPVVKLNDDSYLKAQCHVDRDYYYAVSLHYIYTPIDLDIDYLINSRSFSKSIQYLNSIDLQSLLKAPLDEIIQIDKSIVFLNKLKMVQIRSLESLLKQND